MTAIGFDNKKIIKKYNFVPDAESNLQTVKAKNIPEKYVVFYGRIGEEKGVRLLMKMWNVIDDIPLVVMGSGPLEGEFKSWSDKKNNVYFLGYTEHDKCLAIVKNAEFVVFPSIWYEGCSMVEIETESLGKSLIATDLGFSAEAISDGVNGYKIQLGNVSEFVDKINQLWNSPETCFEMGKNARKDYLDKYTPENNYKQLIKIYESMRE